jgi:FkbM family methyltransferase
MFKKIVKKILNSMGWKLQRAATKQADCQPSRLEFLFLQAKDFGFQPKLIFDIGANHGGWTKIMLKVFPNAKFVLFEPQDQCEKDIRSVLSPSPQSFWRKAAVSNHVGQTQFIKSTWDVTSRLLIEEPSLEKGDAQLIDVEVSTVDQESVNLGVYPDVLKIDAEGADLLVLEGAKNNLGKIEIIVIEAGVCCADFPNSLESVLSKMNACGYDLIGIVDLNSFQTQKGEQKAGILWLVDLVFAVQGGRILKAFRNPLT